MDIYAFVEDLKVQKGIQNVQNIQYKISVILFRGKNHSILRLYSFVYKNMKVHKHSRPNYNIENCSCMSFSNTEKIAKGV